MIVDLDEGWITLPTISSPTIRWGISYATLAETTWELIIPVPGPWPTPLLIRGYPGFSSASGDTLYFGTTYSDNNNPRGWVMVSRRPEGFFITNRARDGTWEPENDPTGRFHYKVRRAWLVPEFWFWIEDHPIVKSLIRPKPEVAQHRIRAP